MTGPRLIGRHEAEHLEKPATTSKTPQNAQTSLVVGMPGAPSLQQETEPKQARQGYSRSPLDASVGPRRGSTRRARGLAVAQGVATSTTSPARPVGTSDQSTERY